MGRMKNTYYSRPQLPSFRVTVGVQEFYIDRLNGNHLPWKAKAVDPRTVPNVVYAQTRHELEIKLVMMFSPKR